MTLESEEPGIVECEKQIPWCVVLLPATVTCRLSRQASHASLVEDVQPSVSSFEADG